MACSIALVLLPYSIPLLFLGLLLKYRKRFAENAVRLQLGFLYDGYMTHAWWFELADIVSTVLTRLRGSNFSVVLLNYLTDAQADPDCHPALPAIAVPDARW